MLSPKWFETMGNNEMTKAMIVSPEETKTCWKLFKYYSSTSGKETNIKQNMMPTASIEWWTK